MSKQSKLIIFRGNSGSGKTTIAKQLQAKLGDSVLLISQDTIRREMLAAKDGPECPAIEWIKQIAQYGNQQRSYVIVEGIMRQEWYGGMLQELMDQFSQSYVYYFDLPFEETLKRHQTKKAPAFGEKELKAWWREKDILQVIDEQFIDSDRTEQQIIESVLDRVLS